MPSFASLRQSLQLKDHASQRELAPEACVEGLEGPRMDGALCKLWLRQQSGALTRGLVSRLRAQRKTCLQTLPLSVMTAPGGGGSASRLAE